VLSVELQICIMRVNMANRHCDTYGKYLSKIAQKPLLTDEEEITLGRQVQAYIPLREAKADLETKLERPITLAEWSGAVEMPPEQVSEIVKVGERAYKRMMEANLRLVVAVAKKYMRRNVEVLDLVQEGNLGLARAVEKFDPGKGYRFSTYAYWWIRQAMTRTIYSDSRQIRLPFHVSETLTMAKCWVGKFISEQGRKPTREELVTHLRGKKKLAPGGSLEDSLALFDWLVEINRPVGSLNYVAKGSDDEGNELIDFMFDGGESPEDYVLDKELRELTMAMIGQLPPQQRRVMTLRFGLEDEQALTLADVGRQMGISRERVRQIQNIATRNLKRYARENGAVELVKTA
jgi:RNA polymerase nonessential primary-like sigma factor